MTRVSYSPSTKKLYLFMAAPWLLLIFKYDSPIIWINIVASTTIISAFIFFFNKFNVIDIDGNTIYINNEKQNQFQISSKSVLFLSKTGTSVSGRPVCNLIYKDFDGSEKTIKFLPLNADSFKLLEDLTENKV